MEQIELLEGFEFWKILVCFIGASLGAFYFYNKSSDYSKQQQWGLGALRFVSIFILLFLLIGPKLRTVTNEYSSPIICLLVDDSESITDNDNHKNLTKRIKKDLEQFKELGYKVELRGFSNVYQHVDSIQFTQQSTDLNAVLHDVQDYYYGLDLSKVVLYSDGIENTGGSALASKFRFRIDAVGVGDTTERKDVRILRLERNDNVYKGNSFLARSVIETNGVDKGKKLKVSIYKEGRKLKDTLVKADKKVIVTFKDTPNKEGIFKYKILVDPLEGEVTEENNFKEFFMEVLEGKDQILLVYSAPHPDVKALRGVFEGRKNFTLEAVSADKVSKVNVGKYQLIIFHGLPTFKYKMTRFLAGVKREDIPVVYFVTHQTYLPLFNASSNVVSIREKGDPNHVGVYGDESFDYFKIAPEFKALLNDVPPIQVPYGTYNLKPKAKVLLGQQVGKLTTDLPLFVMKYNNGKEGVFVGEGFWKWRLHLLMSNRDKIGVFDDYFFNFFQLLANNRSFERLRVQTSGSEFNTNQKVVLKAFIYNELYEEVYGEKIILRVDNEEGDTQVYSFLSTQNTEGFSLPYQQKGVYSYTCEVMLNNKKFVSHGKYVINELNLEQINLQADFDKLRSLSVRHGGLFGNINQAIKETQPAVKVIHSSFEEKELIEYKWLFYILCVVLSIEWFLRKYFGSL